MSLILGFASTIAGAFWLGFIVHEIRDINWRDRCEREYFKIHAVRPFETYDYFGHPMKRNGRAA